MFTVSLWRWTAERQHFSAPIKKPLQTPTLMTHGAKTGEWGEQQGQAEGKNDK